MVKTIGLSLILLSVLAGCSNAPEKPTVIQSVVADNSHLKIDSPDYIQYTVKGLKSLQVNKQSGIVTMSIDDYRQNQHDKRSLLELHKLNHTKDKARVQAYNNLVDALSYEQAAIIKKDQSIRYYEKALERERTQSDIKSLIQTGMTIFGAWVFGNL